MHKSIFIMIALLVSSSSAFAQTPSGIHRINFRILKAHVDNDRDVEKRLFGYLKASGIMSSCIDFRELSGKVSQAVYSGGFAMIAKKTLTPEQEKEISKAICADYLGCTVTVGSVTYDPASVKIGAQTLNDAKIKKTLTPEVPSLSKSCETGASSDSFKDPADSPAAKKYLKKIGIDVNQSKRLVLLDGTSPQPVWDFGIPKQVTPPSSTLGTGSNSSKSKAQKAHE